MEAEKREKNGPWKLNEDLTQKIGNRWYTSIMKSTPTKGETQMSTGSTTAPLSTWSKVVEAIKAETYFAQLDGETADQYVARLNKARDILVKHMIEVKDAATELNKGIKAGREIHPAVFNKINPTREFRTVKDKPSSFNNLQF